jgi:isopentenyl diphosphate isomerase/L-lactate dehydrogenase-like FMN-dependent dehydrogenase
VTPRPTLFDHNLAALFGFATIGINKIYHPTGGVSVASVAQELNLPYSLSSAGSYSIEEVGAANEIGTRFFQLYQSPDDEQALSMLERAQKSGFTAYMLTTEMWQLAWRHNDVHMGNYASYHEYGVGGIGSNGPVFLKRLEEAGIDHEKSRRRPVQSGWTKTSGTSSSWATKNSALTGHRRGHTFTREKTEWLIKGWKRISGGKSFHLKGIQSVADAKRAGAIGCDGIIVSNHAGR